LQKAGQTCVIAASFAIASFITDADLGKKLANGSWKRPAYRCAQMYIV
jgi:hypothetical protein